jgi:hypothetical protein
MRLQWTVRARRTLQAPWACRAEVPRSAKADFLMRALQLHAINSRFTLGPGGHVGWSLRRPEIGRARRSVSIAFAGAVK